MIVFTFAKIVDFLSFPHYPDIKGAGLEEDVDWDDVSRVLTEDDEAKWPEQNKLIAAQLLPGYNALFRVCYGN